MADEGINLFGFEIKRKDQEKEDRKRASFVAPMDEDAGVGNVINAGGHYGQYVDINGDSAKNEKELILKYREISQQPECDAAVEDIVSEAIVSDEESAPVSLLMDDLDQPDRIKKMITTEFETVVSLLNMNWYGHEIFRRWYVDGRLYYHKIIDEANPKGGLLEIRPIDSTRIRKVRELKKEKDE